MATPPVESKQQHIRTDRNETDESLKEERETTDVLLDPDVAPPRIDEVVEERRTTATRRLKELRREVDSTLENRLEALPQVSAELAEAAESMSAAADNLSDVADALSGNVPSRQQPAHEVVSEVTGQLAEIAKGMVEVSATLADERRDVDQTVQHERDVTDRIIAQEIDQVETDLADTLADQQETLIEKREATDEDLAQERRDTDEAVEQVFDLLRTEEQAHESAKRRFASRNEFLAIVSHDLRAPLMGIMGAAQMIEHASQDERGARIPEWAALIRRSASAMERLILDLLDFGGLEDGQLRVVAEPLDLAPAVRLAVESLQPLAAEKSLSLTASFPPEPVTAHYDRHRLKQVLSNLIHNAIKFTAEGGEIRVRVSRNGSECRVAVSDTGSGIPQDDLNAIFECFHRGEHTTHSGLGLGLYIARWIVEAHGGRIWAHSRVGEGSTFYFTLPAA